MSPIQLLVRGSNSQTLTSNTLDFSIIAPVGPPGGPGGPGAPGAIAQGLATQGHRGGTGRAWVVVPALVIALRQGIATLIIVLVCLMNTLLIVNATLFSYSSSLLEYMECMEWLYSYMWRWTSVEDQNLSEREQLLWAQN